MIVIDEKSTLDEFNFRWSENSVNEIWRAASIPLISNHLNWKILATLIYFVIFKKGSRFFEFIRINICNFLFRIDVNLKLVQQATLRDRKTIICHNNVSLINNNDDEPCISALIDVPICGKNWINVVNDLVKMIFFQ